MSVMAEQSDESDGFPCHWTHRHGAHDWTPLVADPESPRVLHLLGEKVRCPGKRGPRPVVTPPEQTTFPET